MTNDSQYRRWVEDNFSSDVKEQLFDIYKEALYDDQDGYARVAKTIAKACTLMARLSAEQEKIAQQNVQLASAHEKIASQMLAIQVELKQQATETERLNRTVHRLTVAGVIVAVIAMLLSFAQLVVGILQLLQR